MLVSKVEVIVQESRDAVKLDIGKFTAPEGKEESGFCLTKCELDVDEAQDFRMYY